MQKKIVLSSLIVIIIISFSIYFFIERDFEKVKEVKNVEDSYDIEVEYDIEDIIYSDIDIVIKGWLVQIGSNNKYIKNSDLSNSEIKKEVKSIKLSGYTNILIGLVGIICSIVALLCGGITKIIIAIFVLCIAILSIFQYIFNKKARI